MCVDVWVCIYLCVCVWHKSLTCCTNINCATTCKLLFDCIKCPIHMPLPGWVSSAATPPTPSTPLPPPRVHAHLSSHKCTFNATCYVPLWSRIVVCSPLLCWQHFLQLSHAALFKPSRASAQKTRLAKWPTLRQLANGLRQLLILLILTAAAHSWHLIKLSG